MSNSTDDLIKFCDSAIASGNVVAAFDACDKFIRENPHSSAGFRKRAHLYGRDGLFLRAIADMDEAINREPSNASYYFFRGWWHLETENYLQSEVDESRTIRIEQEENKFEISESAYFFRAFARLKQDNREGAIEDLSMVSDDFLIYLKHFGRLTKKDLAEGIGQRDV